MVHNVVSVSYFEVPVSSLFLNGKLLTRTSLERDKRAVESGQHMSRCGELEDHGLNQKVRWAVWVDTRLQKFLFALALIITSSLFLSSSC